MKYLYIIPCLILAYYSDLYALSPQDIPGRSFIFVRHGTTDWDISKIQDGFIDYPLTEQGQVDARQAATKLKPILVDPAVYSSTFKRAVQTCEIITKSLDIGETTYIKGIRGREYGNVASIYSEILLLAKERKFDAIEDILPESAESKVDFDQRCICALNEVLTKHQDDQKTIVFVSHDEVCKAFGYFLLDKRLSIKKGGIKAFIYDDGSWSAIDY